MLPRISKSVLSISDYAIMKTTHTNEDSRRGIGELNISSLIQLIITPMREI